MSFSLATLGGTKVTSYNNTNTNNINKNTSISPSLEWVEQTALGIKNWSRVSSSENNDVLIVGASADYFYVSNDSGNNWIQYNTLGFSYWGAVCVSGNGNILLAGGTSGAVTNTKSTELYISRDYGNTFSSCNSLMSWGQSCCSYDGQYIYAYRTSQFIYVSSDYGNTWVARQSQRAWSGIGTSYDGSKVCACVNNNYIYVSLDYGVTWTTKLPTTNKPYTDVVVSPNGMYFFVVYFDAGTTTYSFYRSSNSGVGWTLITGGKYPYTSSYAGDKLIGSRYINTPLQLSNDSGATWSSIAETKLWSTASMSSDGTKLIAAANGGYVYLMTGL